MDFIHAWHLWVIVALLMFIAEVFAPSFVPACFGIACLACVPMAYMDLNYKVQLLTFALTALAMFFGIRPMFVKYVHRLAPSAPLVHTNIDALIGKKGIVLERIDPKTSQGRVKVQGEDWRGLSHDDQEIDTGAVIVVVKVDGTKLIVKPLEERKET